MSGLRVGYGIFPPKIASYLMAIKIPYNVNVAAIIAVRESLKDLDYLLDKRHSWMTCQEANERVKKGAVWGENSPLCNSFNMLDKAPET